MIWYHARPERCVSSNTDSCIHVWKDGKGGYQEFLSQLNPNERKEVIEKGTLAGMPVFLKVATLHGNSQGVTDYPVHIGNVDSFAPLPAGLLCKRSSIE
jgi:hypothetical protein